MNKPEIDHLIHQAMRALQKRDKAAARQLLDQVLLATTAPAPDHTEATSLKGMAYIDVNNDRALALLRAAVAAEPQEPQFHLHLGVGLMAASKPEEAATHFKTAVSDSLGAEPAIIALADCFIRTQKVNQAETVLRDGLTQHPNSKPMQMMLSNLRYRAGDAYAALDLFKKAIGPLGTNAPEDALKLARMLSEIHDFDGAQAAITQARKMLPSHPDILITAATIAETHGNKEHIQEIVAEGRRTNLDHPRLLALHLDYAEHVSSDDMRHAERLLASNQEPLASQELHYAVARFHDRQGAYQKAWETSLAAHQRPAPNAGPLQVHQRDFYTPQSLSHSLDVARRIAANSPQASAAPLQQIILAGPPRTGGSLLQTVLAASPKVRSVGERAALLPVLLGLVEADADLMTQAQIDQFQRADIAGLQRMGVANHISVDKTTYNMHVLGMMQKIHPQSVFIDVIRDPRDVFISILMYNLSTHAYASDPEHIVMYLQFRKTAIDAWRADGVDIIPFHYNKFSQDAPTHGKALFEQLGLDWHNEYLAPKNRKVPVKTFSALQVTEPVNTNSTGRWKNYAPFIAPYIDRLTELAEGYGIND